MVVVFMFFRKEILHLKPIIEHMFQHVKGILSLLQKLGHMLSPDLHVDKDFPPCLYWARNKFESG